MKRDLMDILCCPVCKSDLELKIEREEGDEIVAGDLFCSKCDHMYKIEDGIPNLLPPDFK
ncbi:MAG: methytransferase partner Trm112 [Thermoplasmata archaeon]|nr:methytransferase partner Trm112 [Thermoplasmata archaeon]